jgi:hypothetical protein
MCPLFEVECKGSDEKRYDREPSTSPTLPRVYEVAKFGDAREETLRRRPRGVSKSRRSTVNVNLGSTILGHVTDSAR